MRKVAFWIAVGVVALIAHSSTNAQTTLRYQFKKGDKLQYVMEMTNKVLMEVMGNEVRMTQDQTIDLSWEVEAVESDGSGVVKMKFVRARINMDGPTGKVEADSDRTDEPDDMIGKLMHQVVRSMSKFEVTAKISPLGEVKESKVAPGFLEEMKKIPGVEKIATKIDDEVLSSNLRDMNLHFSTDAVKKGSSWTKSVNSKTGLGNVEGLIEFTYEGSETRDGAAIEKIAMLPKLKIEPALPDVELKIKSHKTSGTSYFDNAKGRLQESMQTQVIEMTVEVAGQTIQQKVDSKTSLKLKK